MKVRVEGGGQFSAMALSLQLFLVSVVSLNYVYPQQTGTNHSAQTSHHQITPSCRDRFGRFPPAVFNLHTCSMCLSYLLRDSSGEFRVNMALNYSLLQSTRTGQVVPAEPGNPVAMDTVCQTLASRDCEDWKACCRSAATCCQKQIAVPSSSPTVTGVDDNHDEDEDDDGVGCPMTWDGFSCVDKTAPGVTTVVQCPAFIARFTRQNNGKATRQCWPNATWYTNSLGLEWTDYSSCEKTEDHQTILTLTIVFKAISITLLFPSIAIFLKFRPLRSQLRIKLHINLFVSLALTAIFSLLWEVLVSSDLLHHDQDHVFLKEHQGACKFLNMASRCFLMTTFFWMFCEGFYLTWLMVRSFRPLSSLLFFALFGWGTPVLFCIIYVIIRAASKDDAQCWVTSAGGVEWLLDGPTVACMAVNLVFLLAIMRVMLCQLRPHGQESQPQQSSLTLRRSLRALLILVPLFGLQEFCLLYRPPPSAPGFFVYEVISAAVMNLQGAVVALIFCFFNGEVQGHLKDVYKRLQYKLGGRRGQSRQSLSLTSSLPSRPHRPSLASIDTTTSVILAPLRLSGTKGGAENGDDRRGGGKGVDAGGSRRGRLAALQDSTMERVPESDAHSESNGDLQASDTLPAGDGEWTPSGLFDSGLRPGDREPCDSTIRQTGHGGRACDRHLEERKRRGVTFFSKLWSRRRSSDRNGTGGKRQIPDARRRNDSTPGNTTVGQRFPAIVISQYEHPPSSHIAKEDGMASVGSESRGQYTPPAANTHIPHNFTLLGTHDASRVSNDDTSVDGGNGGKGSACRDGIECRRLVHNPRPRHEEIKPHRIGGAHRTDGRHGSRTLSSVPEDKQRLCSDNGSLQGSDSSASFSSVLPSESFLEESFLEETCGRTTTAERQVADLSYRSGEKPDSESSHGFFYVNVAFEDDGSKL